VPKEKGETGRNHQEMATRNILITHTIIHRPRIEMLGLVDMASTLSSDSHARPITKKLDYSKSKSPSKRDKPPLRA
jgi:hypothetical protein